MPNCDNKKNYMYIEITTEEGSFGEINRKQKDVLLIKAISDSSAYISAFSKYCNSIKINDELKQSFGKVHSTPTEFKLLNEKGEDIVKSISFAEKEKREKEIKDQIFGIGNSLQEVVDNGRARDLEQLNVSGQVDSVKAKTLVKFFSQNKDEFSSENIVWYQPKSAPKYTNRNGLYCYFQTENGKPSNLRLRFQYYADEWLFFKKIQFSIDGKAFEYYPDATETDSGEGGKIWEWSDQALMESDKEFIYALANAKSAKIKIIGSQYYNVKPVSEEQIKSIKQTLDLFNAMGGRY